MYRQIMHISSDSNFLRILWRFDSKDPIQAYKLLRVTFGTKSAPALATQTLMQLANDEFENFPQASQVLKEDTYVDDVVTGANHETSAIQLRKDLDQLTRNGGFELSKWMSNSLQVMDSIPTENRGSEASLNLDVDKTVKTLGLHWNPSLDSYTYKVQPFTRPTTLTKRYILSDTAQLFDPLGLLSPITVIPKMFLQRLWSEDLDFLHIHPYEIPKEPPMICEEKNVLEEKPPHVIVHHALVDISHIQRYSSFNFLKRVTAYCLRFFNNVKSKNNRISGELRANELISATYRLFKIVQASSFRIEILTLSEKKQLGSKSKLLPLNPFLDEHDLLRVGGRLKKATHIPFEARHPLILPNSHHLTTLIIRHFHVINLHAGPQQLLYILQQQFWIINARKIINYIIKRCKPCAILRAESAKQLMGNLPKPRITPNLAFATTGIDYCGPYLLRPIKGRSPKLFKCYIALFICFVTRGIHLELVSDMTSDSFIAALRRFIARRRKPAEIYSDCGSNFVAANKELREFLRLVKSEEHNRHVCRP
ncbi:unnamed protein product [Allacma fusca]|uniref:Integrase zinc-binding domain-containing protein n=1 Tax=Allacma fusca TaxID=39272 RepID=A0A8J2JS53_9HEXA|nr:unnamed protein product [Allacma fusca]